MVAGKSVALCFPCLSLSFALVWISGKCELFCFTLCLASSLFFSFLYVLTLLGFCLKGELLALKIYELALSLHYLSLSLSFFLCLVSSVSSRQTIKGSGA